MFDDDWSADMEAIEAERLDADLLQAEMERAAADYQAQLEIYKRTGDPNDCPHGSGVGYVDPPVYEEQKQLKPGEFFCWTCRTVMPDPLLAD
ncbi:hypothetical protein [Actinoallomurus sp. NPDC052274]|uniref:hypothetical protein n=1 Tax=Actinoallomurus sp. NPDC052274 TaxID=3155420 RepID=UPI003435B5B6